MSNKRRNILFAIVVVCGLGYHLNKPYIGHSMKYSNATSQSLILKQEFHYTLVWG